MLRVIFIILKYIGFQIFKSFRTDVVNYRDGCDMSLLYSASCFLFTVNYSFCIAGMFAFLSGAVKYQYFNKIKQNSHPADFYILVKSQALALIVLLGL